jgi:hypothetical protein
MVLDGVLGMVSDGPGDVMGWDSLGRCLGRCIGMVFGGGGV